MKELQPEILNLNQCNLNLQKQKTGKNKNCTEFESRTETKGRIQSDMMFLKGKIVVMLRCMIGSGKYLWTTQRSILIGSQVRCRKVTFGNQEFMSETNSK